MERWKEQGEEQEQEELDEQEDVMLVNILAMMPNEEMANYSMHLNAHHNRQRTSSIIVCLSTLWSSMISSSFRWDGH